LLLAEITLSETSWSYSVALEELKESLTTEIAKKKEEEMKKAVEEFKKSLQFSLLEPLSAALGEGKDSMWAEIQKIIVRIVSVADVFVNQFQRDFACTPTELQEQKLSVRQQILSMVHLRILDEVSDSTFYAKLKKRFELHFKYDEGHRPRIWRTLEEITPRFDHAKLQVRLFVCLFVCLAFLLL
jgi:hypothetical protein